MELTLLSLKYFQKVAQLQHLSKAAAELHVAQPALSRTIRALEENLGVPLFERQGRNIVLNSYGRTALKYVDRVLLSLDGMRQELAEQRKGESSTVTLSLYAASKIVPSLLMDFRKEHPSIRFQILQQNASAEESIHADLSLFSSITPIENRHSVTLLEEEIMLAMPESDPRASLSSVPLAAFADAGFIGLQQGKSLRTIMDFYCNMAGFTPRISLECDSPGIIREFIRAGLGVSFVPRITWSNVEADKVALLPISSPQCRRYIGLSWDENSYLSPAAVLLRDYLIAHFAERAISASYMDKK